MKKPSMPLTGKELAEWDAGRDLLAEIDAGVNLMLKGGEATSHVVEVTEAIHVLRNRRISQAKLRRGLD